jgi:hypothetical protein
MQEILQIRTECMVPCRLVRLIIAAAAMTVIAPMVAWPQVSERRVSGGAQGITAGLSIPPSKPEFRLGSASILYDTATDGARGCKPFLDGQINLISFPNANGSVIEFSIVDLRGHNYLVKGTLSKAGSLSPFKVGCKPVFTSALDGSADSFAGGEWISGMYKSDQNTILAIVHSEYYGGEYPQTGSEFHKSDRCPSGQPLTCTYAAITAALSTDGGRTFRRTGATPNDYVIARPPFSYSPIYNTTTGYFLNSNILRKDDGYYYMMISELRPDFTRSDCLIRTSTLSVSSSWRAYDGEKFGSDIHIGADCRGVSIKIAPFYIAYSTFFKRFIAVGTDLVSPFHFSYSLSSDLISWSSPVDLGIAPQWSPNSASPTQWGNYNYPSLVDLNALRDTDDQNSSSGAVVGQEPQLLYIDRMGDNTGTRLLARQLTFLDNH